ncbi:MAG: SAM-dependent chlorinase/fluorinase [Deltaproteobacteria bacterium]|nr:SAM-dependent chlorinase/fluorinase [Deltaproteobacteria bacterium]
MPQRPTIALLTDFGTREGYVAAIKGVILRRLPDATLIDISHEVTAHDVTTGALLLLDVAPYLPPGAVCVGVIDPGVGTARLPLAIECVGRALHLVGPDNGLLFPLASAGEFRAHAITSAAAVAPAISATFHGRDLFAPAAALLAAGATVDQLGPAVPRLVELQLPRPVFEDRRRCGQILRIDRFGNLISNILRSDLPLGVAAEALRFDVGGVIVNGLSLSYGLAAPAALLATVGGFDRIEIAVNGGSAAERLGLVSEMSIPLIVSWD